MDRKEQYQDSRAQAAIWAEGQALLKEDAWLPETMIEKDDLIERARKSGKKIHMGNLLTICSIKFHEMAQEYWKYKGRICFRRDEVKDEYGAPAVFQNLSESPTGVHTTNTTIAWGSLPGHSTQVSDAIRAYIQSYLNSQHETWVLIPPELRPKHWKARRPMCRLVKALYGHPESGGHWEAHLASSYSHRRQACGQPPQLILFRKQSYASYCVCR